MEAKTGIIPVDFVTAKEILDSCPGSLLIDVRTEDEYETEHALGAVLLPLDTITKKTAAARIPSKDTPLLLYCRTGQRAGMAAQLLRSFGYRTIYDLGGLNGWPYGFDYGIEL